MNCCCLFYFFPPCKGLLDILYRHPDNLFDIPSLERHLDTFNYYAVMKYFLQIFDLTRFFGRFGPVSCATALCFLHNIYVHGRSAAFIVD